MGQQNPLVSGASTPAAPFAKFTVPCEKAGTPFATIRRKASARIIVERGEVRRRAPKIMAIARLSAISAADDGSGIGNTTPWSPTILGVGIVPPPRLT